MTEDVRLENLTYRYRGAVAPAVEGLSLRIDAGSLTSLLGPSGCGKSTVLKMIAGLLPPAEGDILLGERSILNLAPEKRGAVMMFQDHLLFPYMTITENIGFGLKMRGVGKAEIQGRVQDMMDLVQLGGLGQRKPDALSGGQQQRAALARALVVQPRILLLDEPFSNLDANLRIEMRALLKELQRQTTTTTLFVTHDQEEAVTLSDRIALLLAGKLRQSDVPAAFYERPDDKHIAQFFGGRNFIEGVSRNGAFECALGRLTLPPGCVEGNGELTFRPENIRLGETKDGPNRFTARLLSKEFLGSQSRLHLRIGEIGFDALLAPENAREFEIGDEIPVYLPPPALWVLA